MRFQTIAMAIFAFGALSAAVPMPDSSSNSLEARSRNSRGGKGTFDAGIKRDVEDLEEIIEAVRRLQNSKSGGIIYDSSMKRDVEDAEEDAEELSKRSRNSRGGKGTFDAGI